jgi:hypothetical protein
MPPEGRVLQMRVLTNADETGWETVRLAKAAAFYGDNVTAYFPQIDPWLYERSAAELVGGEAALVERLLTASGGDNSPYLSDWGRQLALSPSPRLVDWRAVHQLAHSSAANIVHVELNGAILTAHELFDDFNQSSRDVWVLDEAAQHYALWRFFVYRPLEIAALELLQRAPAPVDPASVWTSRLDFAEGVVIRELFAGLPAFPDAEWDVLLDVRDRMRPSRMRLRSAFLTAAQEVAQVSPADLAGAVEVIRRGRIEPALADVNDDLRELGALPTLLRVADNTKLAEVGAAALCIIASGLAGPVDLSALTGLLASAPVLAAAAREAAHRHRVRQDVTRNQYWLLHALNDPSLTH